MDKDDAGFFGYDKAEKRRNTWCIPSCYCYYNFVIIYFDKYD